MKNNPGIHQTMQIEHHQEKNRVSNLASFSKYVQQSKNLSTITKQLAVPDASGGPKVIETVANSFT